MPLSPTRAIASGFSAEHRKANSGRHGWKWEDTHCDGINPTKSQPYPVWFPEGFNSPDPKRIPKPAPRDGAGRNSNLRARRPELFHLPG